jgi:putative ABC transport system substrate-binding protein
MSGLSRRQFLVGTGASSAVLLAGCGRLPWQRQPPAKVARIGWLSASDPNSPVGQAFVEGMREHGYVQGQNLVVEWRPTRGTTEQLSALAAELVQFPVDVIVTGSTPAIQTAMEATSTIPIVFGSGGDPVGTGVAASLARPGGNVTGLTAMTPQLTGKRLELLKETVPGAARVAGLWNPATAADVLAWRAVQEAAPNLGVEAISLEVLSPSDFEGAFAAATHARADAVFLSADPLLAGERAPEIPEFAARHRLPTMFAWRGGVEAGGLMSYGVSLAGQYRRVAYYVDRILRGAKPADLPIEQPMRFEFVVNLKTAQSLDITFPNEIMLQVTDVIQ